MPAWKAGDRRYRHGLRRIGFQRGQQRGGDRRRHPQAPLLAQRVLDVLLRDEIELGENIAQPLPRLALQCDCAGKLLFRNQFLFDQQLTQHGFVLITR
jgi:hypothetical protein